MQHKVNYLSHYKWQWIYQYVCTLYATGHQQTQHLATYRNITTH